jgi:hypothetical protein
VGQAHAIANKKENIFGFLCMDVQRNRKNKQEQNKDVFDREESCFCHFKVDQDVG